MDGDSWMDSFVVLGPTAARKPAGRLQSHEADVHRHFLQGGGRK